MNTLEELIAYKARKQETVLHKKEALKTLNNYFNENKYGIIWAQLNPFSKDSKSSISPYVEGLLSVVPPEILGLKSSETGKINLNAVPGTIGLYLGKMAIRAILKRIKSKSPKRKKKKVEEEDK